MLKPPAGLHAVRIAAFQKAVLDKSVSRCLSLASRAGAGVYFAWLYGEEGLALQQRYLGKFIGYFSTETGRRGCRSAT